MPTAERSKVCYEGGQTAVAMSALTDSGDNTTFTGSQLFWSKRTGFAPVIRPDGLVTGGVVSIAASGSNDVVDVAALTAYVTGELETVSAAADESITRPVTAVAKVNSVTVTGAGAVAVVAGTDGGSTTFSETRGAAGGPPYIATTSIEIAQVRVTSDTAAAIVASEIFSVIGTHTERFDYPLWDIDYGNGSTNAGVTFGAALPDIHTGDVPKAVHASYAGPIFADIQRATDFVPPENSHSVASQQIYGSTIGAATTTLNAGTFTGFLENGVDDPLVQLADQELWFKFFPDRTVTTKYIACQGKLGIARTFPPGDQIQTACTIAAESPAVEVVG